MFQNCAALVLIFELLPGLCCTSRTLLSEQHKYHSEKQTLKCKDRLCLQGIEVALKSKFVVLHMYDCYQIHGLVLLS